MHSDPIFAGPAAWGTVSGWRRVFCAVVRRLYRIFNGDTILGVLGQDNSVVDIEAGLGPDADPSDGGARGSWVGLREAAAGSSGIVLSISVSDTGIGISKVSCVVYENTNFLRPCTGRPSLSK